MKHLFFILILLFMFITKTKSAFPEYFIRPGIKLGYQFGENGGFVYGFELGLTNYNNDKHMFGLLSGIEFCNGNRKMHFGLELSAGIVAFEIGPTIYHLDDKKLYGLTIGVNSLYYVTPYLEYTKIFKDDELSFYQTGANIRAPIPLSDILRFILFYPN